MEQNHQFNNPKCTNFHLEFKKEQNLLTVITNSTSGVKSQEQVLPAGQVGDIRRLGERGGDLPRGLDPSELNETHASGGGGLGDQLGGLTLTLSPNDRRPPLLLRLRHNEPGPLRLLLRHLLLLHRP